MLVEELNKGDTLRVEFVTQVGFPQAEHLARLLGFEYEGTMRKYYNGIDFKMWGKV
jgi:RimJ/RimL family protein N-acetyltransferase